MENLLQGLSRVSVYIDILVTGTSDVHHLQTLEEVLSCLQAVGARLRQEKCSFMRKQVQSLGHVIDEEGLHPSPERVKAIL